MEPGQVMKYCPATETSKVFLVTSVSDIDCGGGNHIFNLATGLLQQGSNVHAVCFDPGSLSGELRRADIPLHLCPIRRKSDWRGWMNLRQLLRAQRPAIVHSHGERSTFMAGWAAKTENIPSHIATIHRSLPHTVSWPWPHRWLYTMLENLSLRLATTAIIAVSESLRMSLIEERGQDPGKITAIPNGTHMLATDDIAEFRHQAIELRRSLAIADAAYVIGSVGRVEQEKGHQYLIQALPAVLEHVPKACVVVVGDGQYRQHLASLVEALNVEAHVRLVGHQNDVNPWFALFDLFVLPTPWEAFGLAILEAMRFSIPVIATDCAGPAEIIENRVSGILVPPADAVTLAQAITALGRDPELSRLIGRRGFETVQRRYSIQRMVQATVALYETVLAESAAIHG
jgi:glycosyltransferase involved in cell wall biosynthesis